MVIRNIQHLCGNIPVSVCFNLFDKMIVPILLYGAEVWGYTIRPDIENVHIKFCKYILGVSRNTSNCAVLGECGRKPLYVLYMSKCIKYWLKLVQFYELSRYPKCCYTVLYELDIAGRHTWATDVKIILYRYGFGHVWLAQGVGNVDLFLCLFKQRLADIAMQDWSSEINSLSKLTTYCTFKTLLDSEIYLHCISFYQYRRALAKLRCSSHRLAIGRLRGVVDRPGRVCKYCLNLKNCSFIEDEYHFIIKCPLYETIRQTYISQYCIDRSPVNFVYILSSKSETVIKRLAMYTYYAFKLHSEFMAFS